MKKISKQIKLLSLNSYLITTGRLIICLLLFKNSISQNLVNNGSFEHYATDSGTSGCVSQFDSLKKWQVAFQSPDVYTAPCTYTNHYGVPNNRNGVSYPVNGITYVGIVCYYKTLEVKEYFFQHLPNPLISGKSYYVSFYTSRADRSGYSIKNIGANFSVAQPTVISVPYITATPQIQNQSGYLTDTIGWTKIEGYFKAQGGEQYITIGNFNSNTDTDTLYSGTTNPIPFDNGMSYYYIDSVSLYDSLDYVTGIHDIKKTERFSLYPNPNNGSFNLEYKINTEAEFVITDVTGRLINHYILFPSQNNLPIKEEELTAGVYFYYIRQNNQLLKQNKFVVIK